MPSFLPAAVLLSALCSARASFDHRPPNVIWAANGRDETRRSSTPFIYNTLYTENPKTSLLGSRNLIRKRQPLEFPYDESQGAYIVTQNDVRAPPVISLPGVPVEPGDTGLTDTRCLDDGTCGDQVAYFATSRPVVMYAMKLGDEPKGYVEQALWSETIYPNSDDAYVWSSPVLGRSVSRDPDTNSSWVDDMVFIGITDVVSGGADNSRIVAFYTNQTRYTNNHVAWQYPPTRDYKSSDGSQFGTLYGSGAIDADGTLYWGTRCKGFVYRPYGKDRPSTCGEGGGNSTLVALNVSTGELEWKIDLAHGTSGTPLITDHFVYVMTYGELVSVHRTNTRNGTRGQIHGRWSLFEDPAEFPRTKLCHVSTIGNSSSGEGGYKTGGYFNTQYRHQAESSPVLGLAGDLVVGLYKCVISLSLEELERGYPLSGLGRLERAFSADHGYPAVAWRRSQATEQEGQDGSVGWKGDERQKVIRRTCQSNGEECKHHGRFPNSEVHTNVAVSAHDVKYYVATEDGVITCFKPKNGITKWYAVLKSDYIAGKIIGETATKEIKDKGDEDWDAEVDKYVVTPLASPIVLGDGTIMLLTGHTVSNRGFLIGARKPSFKGQIENRNSQGRANFWFEMDLGQDALFATGIGGGMAVGREGEILIPSIASDGMRVFKDPGVRYRDLEQYVPGGCARGMYRWSSVIEEKYPHLYEDSNNGTSSTDLSLQKFLTSHAPDMCTYCPAGKFGNSADKTYCKIPEAGEWTAQVGAMFVYKCKEDKWCPGGLAAIGEPNTECKGEDGVALKDPNCIKLTKGFDCLGWANGKPDAKKWKEGDPEIVWEDTGGPRDIFGTACSKCYQEDYDPDIRGFPAYMHYINDHPVYADWEKRPADHNRYYSVGALCSECPDGGSVGQTMVVFATVALCLYGLLRFSGANSYVTGTKFSHELAVKDEIKVYIPKQVPVKLCGMTLFNKQLTQPPEKRKVKRVVHDYHLEVDRHFGNRTLVSGVKFKIRKHRKTGRGRWVDGSGRIDVAPSDGVMPDLAVDYFKEFLRIINYLEPVDEEAEKEKDGTSEKGLKKYSKPTVLGKPTYGFQIAATALVIGVGYIQMTSLMLQYDLNYPSFNVELPAWMSWIVTILSLNFPDLVMSPECDWHENFDYWTNWLFTVLFPVICLCGFVLAYYYAERTNQNPAERKAYQDKCVQAMVIFVCVMYVFVTAKAIEPTFCQYLKDGRFVMMYAQDEECKSLLECEDPFDCSYFWYQVLSWFLFLVYGFGIPLTIGLKLRHAYKTNQMNNVNYLQRYGWLYMRYNRDQYAWELVVMARKLLLIICQSLFMGDGKNQAYTSLAVLGVALYLHMQNLPFMSFESLKMRKKRCTEFSANDRLEAGTILSLILVLALGLVSMVLEESDPDDEAQLWIGGLLFSILLGFGGLIVYFYVQAILEQQAEEETMKKEGMYNDNRVAINQMLNL